MRRTYRRAPWWRLPFGIILLVILAGLGYWGYSRFIIGPDGVNKPPTPTALRKAFTPSAITAGLKNTPSAVVQVVEEISQTVALSVMPEDKEAGELAAALKPFSIAYQPSGASFSQVIAQIDQLSWIDGAVYDPNTGQITLVGRSEAGWPALDPDDLAVAFKGVMAGSDDFGVTINPTKEQIEQQARGIMEPGPMNVFYMGGTEGTHMGLGLFHADRFLKDLSIGIDEAGNTVTSAVDGYDSQLALRVKYPPQTGEPWSRLWFQPKNIDVLVTPDGHAMWFQQVAFQAQARYVQFDQNGEMQDIQDIKDIQGHSPAADAFVSFVTVHYQEFAEENSSLKEIQQFAQLVTLARWVRNYHIPMDLSWLDSYPMAPVSTPTSTMCYVARLEQGGNEYSLFGGVDLSPQPNFITEETPALAASLQQFIAKLDLSGGTLHPIQVGGAQKKALPIPSELPPGVNLPAFTQEILGTQEGNPLLRVAWGYDPQKKDGFPGAGWGPDVAQLGLMRQMEPQAGSPEYARLSVTDPQTKTRQLFALDCGAAECGYTSLAGGLIEYPGADGQSLIFDPINRVYTWTNKQAVRVFNAQGRLISEQRDGGKAVYEWDEGGHLVSIQSSSDAWVRLAYSDQEITIQTSSGPGASILAQENGVVFNTPAGIARYSFQNGQVTQVEKPDHSVQTFWYNNRSQVIGSTITLDERNSRLEIEYPRYRIPGFITLTVENAIALVDDYPVDLLAKAGVKKLVLSNKPLKTILWSQGAVTIAKDQLPKVEEVFSRFDPALNPGGAREVAISLEQADTAAVYEREKDHLEIHSPQKEWVIDNLGDITAYGLGQLVEAFVAQQAGAQIISAVSWAAPDGSGYAVRSPASNQSLFIDAGEVALLKKSMAGDGIDPPEIVKSRQAQIEKKFRKYLTGIDPDPGEPIYFDGPPEVAHALRLFWPVVWVSYARSPREAYENSKDKLTIDPANVAFVIAEDQEIPAEVEKLKQRFGAGKVFVARTEKDRETLKAQLEASNLLVLEVAHSPSGSSIQFNSNVSFSTADIEEVNGDAVLLCCNVATGRMPEVLIENGARSVIAAPGGITQEYAYQWINAFSEVISKKQGKVNFLDVLSETDDLLKKIQGEDWRGPVLLPIVFVQEKNPHS